MVGLQRIAANEPCEFSQAMHRFHYAPNFRRVVAFAEEAKLPPLAPSRFIGLCRWHEISPTIYLPDTTLPRPIIRVVFALGRTYAQFGGQRGAGGVPFGVHVERSLVGPAFEDG